MTAKTPDVCYAGPLVRAEANLRHAGDLLSRRRWEEGLAVLRAVSGDIVHAIDLATEEQLAEIAREERHGS